MRKKSTFSWLSVVQCKFISDFATVTQPLWELTREKTEWKWTEEEQTAFHEVKRRLTTAPTMAYYMLDADTRILTEYHCSKHHQMFGDHVFHTWSAIQRAERQWTTINFFAVEFEGFLEYLGIQHKKGVPYWPQRDGEVERFNEPMMKIMRIAEVERIPWKEELQTFLFQYRTTPHTVTGVPPAEMLTLGRRKLRNKVQNMQMRAEPMD